MGWDTNAATQHQEVTAKFLNSLKPMTQHPKFDLLNYSMKAGSQNMSEDMKCTNVHTVTTPTSASNLVHQVWTKS